MIGCSIGNLLGNSSFELAVCAVAGVAPDFDVFISRSSMKHHRGASHSILFAFIISLALAALGTAANNSFLKIFLISAIAGHSHILMDSLTTWRIPLLFPHKKQSSLELDTAVNPFLLCSSAFWLVLIALSNSARQLLSLIAISMPVFYILFRFILKQIAFLRIKDVEGEIALLPTFSPFDWKVVRRWSSDQSFTQKSGIIHILPSRYEEINTRMFPFLPAEVGRAKASLPLNAERDAILFSASIEQIAFFISKFRYTSAVAKLESEIWRVTWSAEEAGIEILALIQKNGEIAGVRINPHWRGKEK